MAPRVSPPADRCPVGCGQPRIVGDDELMVVVGPERDATFLQGDGQLDGLPRQRRAVL
jgi:hypothetical protein